MGKRKQDSSGIMHGANNVVKRLRQALGKPNANKSRKPKDVAFVKGRITTGPQGPEIKTVDIVATGTNVGTSTSLVQSMLATIAQGTASTNRIGDRIHVKSVNVKLNCYLAANAATQPLSSTPVFARWSLVLDKSPDNTTATIGSIFSNNTSNNTQLTVANLERFQVLKTGKTDMAISSAGPQGYCWDEFVPMDIGTRFPDATGEAVSYGLYLVITTNAYSISGAGANVSVDYDCRVRFTDA